MEHVVYVIKNSCKCGSIYDILATQPSKYAKETCEDCGKRYRTGRGADIDMMVIDAVKAVCDPYDGDVFAVRIIIEVLDEAKIGCEEANDVH